MELMKATSVAETQGSDKQVLSITKEIQMDPRRTIS
jgi:hypothetical protein